VLGDVGQRQRGLELQWQALEVNRECANFSGVAACAINLAETLPPQDPQAAMLLDKAESAARQISADNLRGVIACARALRGAETTGMDAARRAWLAGLALIRAARATWEEQTVLASMRAFCAARGVAPFDAG